MVVVVVAAAAAAAAAEQPEWYFLEVAEIGNLDVVRGE